MKKVILSALLLAGITSVSTAQTTDSDQNPNYRRSMEKYMAMKDSSTDYHLMSATIQDIYSVVDWAEEKQKRKDLKAERRFELRKERIKARGQNRRYRRRGRRGYTPYYYNGYGNYNKYNNYNNGNGYGYGNGYNYGLSNDLYILGTLMYLLNQ